MKKQIKFKVGDLVQDSHLNIGIIVKRSTTYHWWVAWNNGDILQIHRRWLELLS